MSERLVHGANTGGARDTGSLPDLYAVWDKYVTQDEFDEGIRPVVKEAWQRCAAFGVDPRVVKRQVLDAGLLREAQAASATLLQVADPFIAAAHAKYGERPHLIALLDPNARVIRIAADAKAAEQGRSINLFEGSSWSEKDFGCNGGGTALAAGKPVVLIGPEHLIEDHLGWTCIGVPLRKPDGTLAGSIDWSVPNDSVELWSWGWVLGIAHAIEEHLAAATSPTCDEARQAIDLLQNPFNLARGVFELLGMQLGGNLPTHAKLLREAAQSLDLAEKTFIQTLRTSADTQQQLAAANQRLLVSTMEATERAKEAREAQENTARLARDLQEADRHKDEFIALLSHELRNPLAPLRSAGYILRRAQGPEQVGRAVDVIERQTAHLTRLVDDLLDVTRISKGKVELRRTQVDLAALAWRAIDDHRALMLERGLEFRAELPRERVLVTGDETRLAQVLGNLLNNAAKFTPSGGRVTLALAAEGQRAVIHVRDTGAGIAPELLGVIFDAFTQGKQTIARSDAGLGLGLALVKGLVAMHGGEVSATSDGPGCGANFVVSLPMARREDTRDVSRAVPPVAAARQRRRVLVVDDNRDAAQTLARLVEMFAHDAEVAYDAPTAFDLVRRRAPDVVLCDIGVPGMNGFAVAKQLRALSPSDVRLIAVSGYAQPEDVAMATQAGFDAHVAKPADPERIALLLS